MRHEIIIEYKHIANLDRVEELDEKIIVAASKEDAITEGSRIVREGFIPQPGKNPLKLVPPAMIQSVTIQPEEDYNFVRMQEALDGCLNKIADIDIPTITIRPTKE